MTIEELRKLYEIAEIDEQMICDLKGICGLDVKEELIHIILRTIEAKLRAYK